MAQVFEDEFGKIQVDMVSICREYVSDRADKIYIYGTAEDNQYYCSFFYNINGVLLKKHKVNEQLDNVDVSENMQMQVNHILVDDLLEIEKAAKKYERKMPTELKLIYDVKKNNLDADFRYDKVLEKNDMAGFEMADRWFDEFCKENK
ncbi:immunity protein YezG family protein [Loigolactobacillus binensis]|uniref:Immunity protein YezG family protein n=1 Tax=Loigolactobacillus binensis TaxID=2559922 RepID=A0ABW3EDP0_9LACO|nr:immunity protein YezG family protein [Loigolactobacillus binensis]